YSGDSGYGGAIESNQRAPRFLSEPAARVHFVNTAGALIHCGQVAGVPSPTVQWVTTGDGQPVTTVHGLRTTFPNGTLHLQPFAANRYRQDVHAATYRCVATNSVGIAGSRDVRVRAGAVVRPSSLRPIRLFTRFSTLHSMRTNSSVCTDAAAATSDRTTGGGLGERRSSFVGRRSVHQE
ncbi:titin-like, partial [Tropilaelaps mercedesae]